MPAARRALGYSFLDCGLHTRAATARRDWTPENVQPLFSGGIYWQPQPPWAVASLPQHVDFSLRSQQVACLSVLQQVGAVSASIWFWPAGI